MKARFLLIILLEMINLFIIFCKECEEEDIGHYITKCDSSNKRKGKKLLMFNLVIQYWKNECTFNSNSNLSLPKIIDSIECDKKCGHGEYFVYLPRENAIYCQKCPVNTYSTGGDLRICGEKKEWTEEVLSHFKNICYVKCEEDDNYKINENCENWKINPNHKNITSGTTNLSQGTYVVELIYNVYLKNPAKLSFGYKKKTRIESNEKINGEFKFYVDYVEIVHDRNITDNFTDVLYDLERGDHSFLWKYHYSKNNFFPIDIDYSDLKMELKYIMIEGMEDGAYECISCAKAKNSAAFSKEGWNHCESCVFGEYYDQAEQICKTCPENYFSFPNSETESSCIPRSQCNEYDYKEIHSECDDDKIEVKYEWEQPITCDNKSYLLPKTRMENCDDNCELGYFKDLNSDNKKRCIPCTEGEYSDKSTNPFTCNECPDGSYAPRFVNITKFHLKNSDIDKFFDSNKCISGLLGVCEIYDFTGWKFRKDGIIPGNNLPRWIELVLTKDIKIIQDKGYVEFSYEIFGLKEEEYFEVFINDVIIDVDLIQNKYHTKRIELSKGNHKLKYKFRREPVVSDSFISDKSSLIIRQLAIYGSDQGGAVKCLKCPPDTISKRHQNPYISKCTKCEYGYTPNAEQTDCIKIKEIEDEETSCPEYSYLDDSKRCVLNDIIHNKSLFLRYFIHDLKSINHHNCKMTDHKKCKNKFIGPIINQNEMEEEDNDIFYISLNNKDKLEVKDFTYAKENGICSSGHAFALFEFNNCTNPELHDSNDYEFTSHTKILKNIGSQIDKITLIPGAPYFNNLNPGLAIKYTNGDICMSNPHLRYSFYIFITCDKSGIYYPPKYIGKLNNNCTYVFEWETRNGCPSCLRKNTIPVANGCFNNTEEIRYEENINCVILNEDESKFSGKEFFSNNTSTVLNKEIMITDPVFSFYFYKKNFINDLDDWEKLIGNIDPNLLNKNFIISNKEVYVDFRKEIVECESSNKILEQLSVVFLIVIPTFYVITSFCMILFYCKYRRINNDYQRLRMRENESNISTVVEDGNELSVISSQTDKINI